MRFFQSAEYRCKCGRATCPAPKEFTPEFEKLLVELRLTIGRPIVINSGLRCPEHTAAVGGVQGSEHESGDGADLQAETAQSRYEILVHALRLFSRVGVGKTFVHVGASKSHARNVVWLY
jgi:uncharacterized protein YcbK (DUF882 family)